MSKTSPISFFRDSFDNEELIRAATEAFNSWRPYSNKWLGLNQLAFGKKYGRKVPAGPLQELCMHQYLRFWEPKSLKPNVAYLQKLQEGQNVNRHKDPFADKHFTTIAWFGSFKGGDLVIESDFKNPIQAEWGRIVRLPCTIGNKRGPWHETTPVIQGERWSLILNYSTNQ